ncbi:GNAT family N-acetyltransferase [Staphylococcus debuckii]|uniref:GNAT family N-acetyltransferase n=1 Tax=Staphylococcus debuckii TaxID=2044912 RepID=A0ABU9EZX2_9STAP
MTDLQKGENQFYIGDVNQPDAIIQFRKVNDQTIDIHYAAVSDTLGNQGMGTKLVEKVIDYANENGLKITCTSSYARNIINHFPEFQQFYANKE